MSYVQTVLGPIAPEEVGLCAMHEHVFFGPPGWEYDPFALAREVLANPAKVYEKIWYDFMDFREAGGRTFVDTSGIAAGRDVEQYVMLAQNTGVHLVACAGFWETRGILPYFACRDVDYFEELMVRDLTEGMEGTTVKAGIIKVACGRIMTPLEEAIFRAAARAAKRTGCAVTTHGVEQALHQTDIFLEEGIDPDRVIIGHLESGHCLDIERDKEIARRGFYVGYDHIGTEPTWSRAVYAMPDEERIPLIQAVIEAGYLDRVILSNDTNGQSSHRPTQFHPYSHLFRVFVPKMRSFGITDDQVRVMLVENPKRVLPMG